MVIMIDHDNTMNYSITKRIKISSTGELYKNWKLLIWSVWEIMINENKDSKRAVTHHY